MSGSSVNAWRFKLAEEEEKRRRQLGFKDIMDLLMTGFQAYQGIQGIKQGRAAQELAQSKQDFNVQKETMGATEAGRIGTWDRAPDNYVGPAPANETAGPMGRMQFTQTGTALDEARRKEELDMLRGGWQSYDENAVGADIMPQHWQRGGGYVRNPLADAEAERGFLEANPPIYDPSQPFTLTNRGHVETPGFVSQGQRDLAGIRAAGSGGDSQHFAQARLAEKEIRNYAMQDAQMQFPQYIDEFSGDFKPGPDAMDYMQERINYYKSQPQYAPLFPGGPDIDDDDPSYEGAMLEWASGLVSEDPAIRAQAEADYASSTPEQKFIVDALREKMGGGQAAPGANDYAGLGFESEPTTGMVEAALEQAGQGLYRENTPEGGVAWSDPEKKAQQDALIQLLRRLRAEAYRNQQSAAPMRAPIIPPLDRQY